MLYTVPYTPDMPSFMGSVSASTGIKSLFKSLLCGKKSASTKKKKEASKEKRPAAAPKQSKRSLIARGYNKNVEKLRKKEYSHLKGRVLAISYLFVGLDRSISVHLLTIA
jgi:hypothetical protein